MANLPTSCVPLDRRAEAPVLSLFRRAVAALNGHAPASRSGSNSAEPQGCRRGAASDRFSHPALPKFSRELDIDYGRYGGH